MAQSMKRQRRLAWGIAAGMTGALFIAAALLFNMKYVINDDIAIMRILMGYDTGTPATFQLHTHGLLVWPIHLLHCIWPLVPWYSYIQLMLLFLSLSVIVKSLMQHFLRCQKPMWIAVLLALSFFVAFGVQHIARISFTYTAALLSASAVAQLFSVDYHNASDKQIICGVCGSLLLSMLAYALRMDVLLPTIAFCGLSLGFLFVEFFGWGNHARRNAKPVLISLIIIVIALGGMLGIRKAELAAYPIQEYLKLDEAMTPVMDYYGLADVPQEILDQVGWDRAVVEAVNWWFTFDQNLTTDAFLTVNDYLLSTSSLTISERLIRAKDLFITEAGYNPHTYRMIAFWFAAVFICIVILLFRSKKQLLLLMLIFLICGFTILMGYLAYTGRMPLRAVLVLFLPALVILFSLLPVWIEKCGFNNRFLIVIVAAILFFSCVSAAPDVHMLSKPDNPEEDGASYMYLAEFALQNPDCLYIYDSTLSDDYRLLPKYSDQTPHNTSFWGGWEARSVESTELFRNFGIDIWHFDPATFLRDDVFFATAAPYASLDVLSNWLEARLCTDISWEIYDQYYDIYIIRLTSH